MPMIGDAYQLSEAQKALIAARDAYMEATQLLIDEPLNAKALQLYAAASERLIEAKVAVAIISARY